jgi:hypothetical protein
MVEDRIRMIEARVQASENLPEPAKAELLELIGALRTELEGLQKEHLERVEAAARGGGGESVGDAMGALAGSMTALEATHPRLADLANRLAVALSNMGI